MDITRRDFLKYSSMTGFALYMGILDLGTIKAYAQDSPVWTSEAYNICPYCGVGCGMIVGSNERGQVTYVQGDPENPNNLGALCSKGANAGQLNHIEGYAGPTAWYKAADSERVIYPLRRNPGASEWVRVTWDDALNDIAAKIKTARDASIDSDMKCPTIGVLGTAKATNEECYLLTKLMRSLGIVYYEHCARL